MNFFDSDLSSDCNEFALELVKIIRHELRTKFTSIKGYSSIIERAGPLTDKQKELLEQALQGVDEAQEVLDRIHAEIEMDVRIQSIRLEEKVDTLDLYTCVDEAAVALEPEDDSTVQNLLRILLPDLPLVQVRKQELLIVLKGLLSTVPRYISSRDVILTAEGAEKFVKVIISSESSYSPTRDESSITESTKSIGKVGEWMRFGLYSLSLSKKLVEDWGGEISYFGSEEEVGGLWFTLPTAEKDGV